MTGMGTLEQCRTGQCSDHWFRQRQTRWSKDLWWSRTRKCKELWLAGAVQGTQPVKDAAASATQHMRLLRLRLQCGVHG